MEPHDNEIRAPSSMHRRTRVVVFSARVDFEAPLEPFEAAAVLIELPLIPGVIEPPALRSVAAAQVEIPNIV
jgi:hypothetical protein